MAEAAKFGFQGTPGFLLNGVPVKGAYPTSHFDNIISELKKRGKINI
jgi:protein-disulfide isomerase